MRDFLTDLNWYVWEQLFFYFIYWVVYRILPAYVELTIGIFSVLFIVLAYINGMESPWYGSSLCFALGLFYYQYEKKYYGIVFDKAVCFKKINYYILLSFMLFITGVSSMLLYKLRIGNRVSYFLGQFSYEIFLVHFYILAILSEISMKSEVLFGILTVVFSITLAYLFHLLTRWIFNLADSFFSRLRYFSH